MVRYEHCNELMHHGIKGQQWGKRNGPPYPLSEGKHKYVINRKKIEKSRVKGMFWMDKNGSFGSGKFEKEIDSDHGPALVSFTDKPGLDLTDPDYNPNVSETRSPTGTALYPPVASVIEAYDKIGNKLFRKKEGYDGVEDAVNPYWGDDLGTTNNCGFCSVAVEMQKRGYDVCARKSFGGVTPGKFASWFKGAEQEYCETIDEFIDDAKKAGNGASGILSGYYGESMENNKGGHAVHWHNDNGNIEIIDGQSHEKMKAEEVQSKYHFGKGCVNTRLDKAEPDFTNMAKDGVLDLDPRNSKYKGMETEYVQDDVSSQSYNYDDPKARWDRPPSYGDYNRVTALRWRSQK